MAMFITSRRKGKGSPKNTWARMLAMVGLDFIIVWSLIADWPLKPLHTLGYVLLLLIFTAVGALDLRSLVRGGQARQ